MTEMRNETVTGTRTDAENRVSEVVEGYFAMWNERDSNRRRVVIAATWAPDGRYVDPMFAGEGADGLDTLVSGAQARYPGHRFRLLSAVDVHHDRARWEWDVVGPDGATPIVAGVDFAVFAPDGRLREVIGFFQTPVGA
jgi:hypothetical protein